MINLLKIHYNPFSNVPFCPLYPLSIWFHVTILRAEIMALSMWWIFQNKKNMVWPRFGVTLRLVVFGIQPPVGAWIPPSIHGQDPGKTHYKCQIVFLRKRWVFHFCKFAQGYCNKDWNWIFNIFFLFLLMSRIWTCSIAMQVCHCWMTHHQCMGCPFNSRLKGW